ncbi:tripartite tricarboxylate transporter TctB family protein [Youngiibacter multivorans]|uniref:ABC-type polysaccharide/polyol phosphate export permease n=1 Tax=Youngiibacter multivorans TaxID=937251 RepID=A0ABS4G8L5_9CLOT|nr:tripartite tricarboxylate transporter TctB family protein [Youngiibacter multivorans]MBP1920876.1 ABC-type polysaccharide/polyol phosphate export permease [Youngiibacter multivorans]
MNTKSIHQDVYISAALFMILALLFTITLKLPDSSSIFPFMLIGGIGILNVFVMLKALSKTKAMRTSESNITNPINWETIKIPMLIFIMTVGYIVIFQFTNFFVSSSIFLITLMKFYKVKSWKVIILTTIIFNVIIYVGFVRFLNVPLI